MRSGLPELHKSDSVRLCLIVWDGIGSLGQGSRSGCRNSPMRHTSKPLPSFLLKAVGAFSPFDSPLTKCLFSRAMAQAHPEVDQSWHGADGEESHDKSLIRAIVGPDQDQKTPAARDGLSRRSGPD